MLPQAVFGALRRASARWGSGLSFLTRKSPEAPREFIGRRGQTRFDRVLRNIDTAIGKAVSVLHAMVGESALSDFACVPEFALQSKGKAALDEPHGLFKSYVR